MQNSFLNHISATLKKAEDEQRFRVVRGLTPLDDGRCILNGQTCIDFSSNDYLGLASHPELIEASVCWTKRFGAGAKGARLITGTLEAVLLLEERIARWKGTEAALLLGSGYMANTGILNAFGGRGTVFFGDKLNHASLNTGCQSPHAEFKRYRHNDLAHLRMLLHDFPESARGMIVSDTVFSMDGDIVDVAALRLMAAEFNLMLYLDDAHAGGVLGENGKGLGGSLMPWELVMGTCSKAFGTYGAYVACSRQIKDFLINSCGSFIFTTALPPAVYGAIDGALSVMMSGEGAMRRERVARHSARLRTALREAGLNIGNTETPIVPVIVGDNVKVKRISAALREKGFLCVAICPPTVPQGSARLRISVSAAHSDADIEALIQTLIPLCL